MPTSTVDVLTFISTNGGYAWAWALAVGGALFVFALGTTALKSGARAVLRHVRGIFRI